MYDQCPSSGSADCLDENTSNAEVSCFVTSAAGRVGSSYAARLSGPEAVSGVVEYTNNGLFEAEYIGPLAGDYELEVCRIDTFARSRGEIMEESLCLIQIPTQVIPLKSSSRNPL